MKDYDSDDIPPDLIPKYGAGIISGPLVFLVQAPLHQYMGVFFICCGGLTICVVSYLATTPRYRKKFAQEIQGKETVYNYDAIFRIASSFTVIAVTTALFSVGFRDSHSISHYVGAYLGGYSSFALGFLVILFTLIIATDPSREKKVKSTVILAMGVSMFSFFIYSTLKHLF